jgi:nucleoside phosphorylase
VLGVVTGLKSEAKLLEGLKLACVSTGGRADEARGKIERLIAEGATGLVSFGIAGALSPDLKKGDLVIAEVVAGEAGETWQTHRPWVGELLSAALEGSNRRPDDVPHHAAARRSEGHATSAPSWAGGNGEWQAEGSGRAAESSTVGRHPGVVPGPVPSSGDIGRMGPGSRRFAAVRNDNGGGVTVGAILGLDRMVSSPQEKADAFARSGALAIDMESHHVARAAAERGVPFIAVRAVSDQAHEVLPAIMATFVDTDGQTKMSAVLAALIFGRVKLGELLQAGRSAKQAHRALFRCRGALAGLR